MYNLPHFKETNPEEIIPFMHEHPFAFLSGSTVAGKLIATQIPLLTEERNGELFLLGHVMRGTDHFKAFSENPSVLAVFTGPHTYVSASWYSNPHMGSTWNYMSVHAAGKVSILPEEGLRELMRKLSLKFEGNNGSSPTVFDNLSPDYLKQMLPAIAGIEIKVESLEHVFKLSQNRDEQSYRNIIAELEKQGGDGKLIAAEMRKRAAKLFSK